MAKFRIEGLREINDVLGQLPRGMGKAALVRFGTRRLVPMRDTAKANAPVDEGDLRDSIEISTRQGTPGQRRKRFENKAAVEIAMGPTADGYPQAVPQEMGFKGKPPVGYMRRAWDEHHGALLDDIAKDLGDEIQRTAKRHARKVAGRRG